MTAAVKVGSEFLVNTKTASFQQLSTITSLSNGGFVVSWSDYSGTLGDADGSSIKAQVFSASGVKVGSEFLVNTQMASNQDEPTITGLSNGGFVVSWYDSSGTLGDGSVGSIKAQVFDASGGKLGSEFLGNTETESGQYAPTITGLSNGGFVVSWHDWSGTLGDADGTSIKAQVFDDSGSKLGSEFLVNTQTSSHQRAPTITGLSNGGFVVSWRDYSGTLGDADGTSIKAQVFDPSGGKLGSEFLVNTQTASDQHVPMITSLSNGGFVVSWEDYSGTLGDADRPSIKAQVFDASGGKLGSEFLVNTETANTQYSPTITGLSNGGFVVSWYDFSGTLGDADGTSIKAQIFSVDGTTLHYDISGKLIGETFIHDGVREETSYGVTGHSYASETLIYDQTTGTLLETKRFYDDAQTRPFSDQVFNADGTGTVTYWTAANVKSVYQLDAAGKTTERDSYDSAGRHTFAKTFNADGSSVSQRFHVGTGKVISQTITDTNGKVVEFDSYSNAGVQTRSEKFLADGSRTVDVFNAAGAPINETLFRTDGTQMVTFYYPAGNRYADSVTEYDASHRMTSKDYHYAGAAHTLASSQTFGADGSSETLIYDTAGRLTLDTVIAANGAKSVTQDTYAGSNMTPETILFTQYDAGGARQWTDQTKADGSHAQRSFVGGLTLTSNAGVADTFTGFTGGTDTFVFTDTDFGKDTVSGFTAGSGTGHDVLQFSASVAADFATLQTLMTKSGKDTLITLDAGNSVLLKNVAPAVLVAADFSFVG